MRRLFTQSFRRGFLPLVSSVTPQPWVASANFLTWTASWRMRQVEDDDDVFDFDATASIKKDVAAAENVKKMTSLIQSAFPKGVTPELQSKIEKYLKEHPVDEAISSGVVNVTHIVDPATKEMNRLSEKNTTKKEAIARARKLNCHLVQMAEKKGVAYCRIRNEAETLISLFGDAPPAAPVVGKDSIPSGRELSKKEQERKHITEKNDGQALDVKDGDKVAQPTKLMDTKEIEIKDTVDHGHLSKKIREAAHLLAHGHPVRFRILQFQSAESAINTMKLAASQLKAYASTGAIPRPENSKEDGNSHFATTSLRRLSKKEIKELQQSGESKTLEEKHALAFGQRQAMLIPHYHVGVMVGEAEVRVEFRPHILEEGQEPVRSIRHPSDSEFDDAFVKLTKKLKASNRSGTYKPRENVKMNVGDRSFRVDRFGNRIEDPWENRVKSREDWINAPDRTDLVERKKGHKK